MVQANFKSLYNSKRWHDVRAYVLSRDHHLCYLCKGAGANIVHHVIWITEENYQDIFITLNPNNLITVCHDCHNMIHLNTEQHESKISFDEQGNIIPKVEMPKPIDDNKLKQLRNQSIQCFH